MSFRFTPNEEVADFDHLVWDRYMEVYPSNFDGEYKDFFKQTIPGVVSINTGPGDSIIEHIDFESEKYYTMFLLRWT